MAQKGDDLCLWSKRLRFTIGIAFPWRPTIAICFFLTFNSMIYFTRVYYSAFDISMKLFNIMIFILKYKRFAEKESVRLKYAVHFMNNIILMTFSFIIRFRCIRFILLSQDWDHSNVFLIQRDNCHRVNLKGFLEMRKYNFSESCFIT